MGRSISVPFACLLLASALSLASACVYLYGDAPNSHAPHPPSTHWNHGRMGDNWVGVDTQNKSWSCTSGKNQSPINLSPSNAASGKKHLKTKWNYPKLTSNGSDVTIINSGHTIQVQWTKQDWKTDVSIPTTGKANAHLLDVLTNAMDKPSSNIVRVQAQPLQFHFHTASEHEVKGMNPVLEMHIVHAVPKSAAAGCPDSGCLTVTGVMLYEAEEDNAALEPILAAAPMQEGISIALPAGTTIDVEALLPPPNQRQYMQYSGSLTTPPCTEGLLWHVFSTQVPIGRKQLTRYYELVGLKDCQAKTTAGTADHSHAHRHLSHDDHSHAAPIGTFSPRNLAYGGRTTYSNLPAERRSLAEGNATEHTVNPDDYTCEVVAYGHNNRRVQPLNGRVIKRY